MTVVLGFVTFFLVLNLAALTGWAPSTRDSHDWTGGQRRPSRRGPVRIPATWLGATSATAELAQQPRHSPLPLRVDSSQLGEVRPDTTCGTHAVAA